MFQDLVKKSFIVLKQPPQEIRTGSKFKADALSLVGNKIFAECSANPSVTVSLLPGDEAVNLNPKTFSAHVEKENEGKKFGFINNSKETFGNNKAKKVPDKALVDFQNLQFSNKPEHRIKRNRANGPVTEELFALVFRTEVTCYGLKFDIWTHSSPIVIISHDSQKEQASATTLWDNAGNKAFERQDELPWPQVFA